MFGLANRAPVRDVLILDRVKGDRRARPIRSMPAALRPAAVIGRPRPVRQRSRAGRGSYCRVVMDPSVLVAFQRRDPDAVRSLYREYGRLVFTGRASSAGADRTSRKRRRSRRSCARGSPPTASTPSATPRRGSRRLRSARRSTSIAGKRAGRRARSTTWRPTIPGSSTLPPDLATIDAVWHVRRAIDVLPAEEATVARLQHLEGMTHREIAPTARRARGNRQVQIPSRPRQARGAAGPSAGAGDMNDQPISEDRHAMIADGRRTRARTRRGRRRRAARRPARRSVDVGRTASRTRGRGRAQRRRAHHPRPLGEQRRPAPDAPRLDPRPWRPPR